MINPEHVNSNAIDLIDINYIKSCIMNRKMLISIYQNTRKNIVEQIEALSEEEAALVLPGGENQDNLGIRSSGIVDAAYSQHAKLAKANIFKRQKSLMRHLDEVEDRINSLHRIIQIFNLCSILYPMHYAICEAYLYRRDEETEKNSAYKEESGYRKLEIKFGSSHKTLRVMLNNLCEMVRELTIADLAGENIIALSPDEIKDKLSKELVEALDKNEFNQRGRK